VLCVLLLFEESFVLLHQSSKSSFVRRGVLQPKVGGMGVASAAWIQQHSIGSKKLEQIVSTVSLQAVCIVWIA